MGKSWHFIKNQNQKAKENLQTKANQNQKNKNNEVVSRKALSLYPYS
jgi:hypothetical protein